MGTDWNQPRDTGPSATDWEDQRERLRPRKQLPRRKRRYGIESKPSAACIERMRKWESRGISLGDEKLFDWSLERQYETAKQRDEALEKLLRNQNHGVRFGWAYEWTYEYRPVDLDP